jgi:hypothetical protein
MLDPLIYVSLFLLQDFIALNCAFVLLVIPEFGNFSLTRVFCIMPRFPQYFAHPERLRIRWNSGVLARLPQTYKNFYEEWQHGVRTPVHWKPHEQEYVRNEKGEM